MKRINLPTVASKKFKKSRCWVAAHMCVLSHFRTCDVRAEVRAERVWNCACGSACVWAIFRLAICDRTFYLIFLKYVCTFQAFFHIYFFRIHTFLSIILNCRRRCARRHTGAARRSIIILLPLMYSYSAVYYIVVVCPSLLNTFIA